MSEGRRRHLPLVGMGLGAALAWSGLLERVEPVRSPRDVADDPPVVTVDGRPIGRAELARAVAAYEAGGRRADAETRARILERLVDEELLVQHGLDLGLAENEPRIRTELTRAVLELSNARARAAGEPDEATLRDHFEAHRARFVRPRLRVARVYLARRGTLASDRARAARVHAALLRGVVEAGDPPPVPFASEPVHEAELRETFGARVTDALLAARDGTWLAPIEANGGFEILRRIETHDVGGGFDEVRDEVRMDLERMRADRQLESLLDELRRRHPVVRGPG